MNITLTAELEAALIASARQKGISPKDLALEALRDRFLTASAPPTPNDEWERTLFAAAKDCGVSLPHSALSREELYD